MTDEVKEKISKSFPGPSRKNFKGGFYTKSARGQKYFKSWVEPQERKNHPTTDKRGYILRSHLVWNKSHPVDPVRHGQIVHHINGDALDDRIENLCRVNHQSEHLKFHSKELSKRVSETNKRRKK